VLVGTGGGGSTVPVGTGVVAVPVGTGVVAVPVGTGVVVVPVGNGDVLVTLGSGPAVPQAHEPSVPSAWQSCVACVPSVQAHITVLPGSQEPPPEGVSSLAPHPRVTKTKSAEYRNERMKLVMKALL
jgi:hypothetical protein